MERYKCDRNGGTPGRYLLRKPWWCPSCGELKEMAGHRCADCRRRVCCSCFHHDLGCCLAAAGSDCRPSFAVLFDMPAPCPANPDNNREVLLSNLEAYNKWMSND